ncbi:MAG: N-acetylneuraminate synthase [Firmicutes bacterium]|nr:N-acetylneuraminate synthase [Bacillota bacterium]
MFYNNHTFVIAEAGVNHNGSIDLAIQLIDVAVEAGADAVKFQTFKADQMMSGNAPKAEYQTNGTNIDETQFEMIRKLELNESTHKTLTEYCNQREIEFLSTPFDIPSLDLLSTQFNLSRIKISSGDITNGPMLLKVAQKGKPVILSTGMSNLGEIEMALGILAFGYMQSKEKPSLSAFRKAYCSEIGQKYLRENVVLLHCTTEYPAPFNDVNLLAMDTLHNAFGLKVGYSDHTSGIAISIAAVARGAKIIEKHFTLDRKLPGPDHKASLEPQELKEMIHSIRQVEIALGSPLKKLTESEEKNMLVARKSVVALTDIKKGKEFTSENIGIKRPGTETSPVFYWKLLGTLASKDFRKDEVIDL